MKKQHAIIAFTAIILWVGCERSIGIYHNPGFDGAVSQDASLDAAVPDTGTDADVDSGTDSGVDAGIDSGVDSGVDAGPPIEILVERDEAQTPGDRMIPKDEQNVLFLVILVHSSDLAPIEIRSITIDREGLGNDDEFASVSISNSQGVLATSNIHPVFGNATFNISEIIPQGTITVPLWFHGDLNGVNNSEHRLCIEYPTDIEAYSTVTMERVTILDFWPICGGIVNLTDPP